MNPRKILLMFFFMAAGLLSQPTAFASVTIYPAPVGEALSDDFKVQVDSRDVPVYKVRVAPQDAQRRLDAMDYSINGIGHIYDEAAFTYFDMQGAVEISVSYKDPIISARLLPDSPDTKLTTDGNTVHFTLAGPRNFTLEVNNEIVRTLHIFANPTETNAPSPGDPDVVYFGPGVHEVSNLVIGDGKTLYIAGGSIIKIVVGPGESFNIDKLRNQRHYKPAIKLQGSDIKVRGRGIIDGSMVPQGKGLLSIIGHNISLEGIILQDSSSWNMPIRNSDDVTVTNLKILGYRLNSDGIDIVSSHNVVVQDCFIRSFDDLIVVKSHVDGGNASNIVAQRNVLWNDKAHALTIGTDVQTDVSDVTFTDNYVRDLGHDWSMAIFLSDSGNVSNVRFENIQIDEGCIDGVPAKKCPGLINLHIGKSSWGRGGEMGSIHGVSFTNIQATTSSPQKWIVLSGVSGTSDIEDVRFNNVVVNKQPISSKDVRRNHFVSDITVNP